MAFIRGGNIWVAGGVLMLLLGFAFLPTYMAERGYFSVELRIALAVLTGMAMVGFGLTLRDKKPVYALVMQGGGIGILYLSAFVSAKLTALLPPAAALAAITALIIPAAMLAIAALSSAFWQAGKTAASRQGAGEQDEHSPLPGLLARIRQAGDSGDASGAHQVFRLERALIILAFIYWFGGLLLECRHYAPESFAVFFLCASLSASALFVTARYSGLRDLFLACWIVVPLSLVKIAWSLIFAGMYLLPQEGGGGLRALFTHQFLAGTGGIAVYLMRSMKK